MAMKAGGAAAVKTAAKPLGNAPATAKAAPAATAASKAAPAAAKAGAAKAAPALAPAAAKAGAAKAASAQAPAAAKAGAATADSKAAEAAAAAVAESAAADAARIAAAEAAGTGEITLVYDVNRHQLQISKGRTTADAIDEETALTFAYPACQIHLTQQPVRGIDWRTVAWDKLEARDADGVFSGLLAGKVYYCVVVEDGKERARYEKEQAERSAKALAAYEARLAAAAGGAPVDRQLSLESCSCIEGNPCQEPACCQDWSGRFENARRIMEEKSKRK